MLREYLQFRFRLSSCRDAREIVQTAMSSSLGRSWRCKHWELLQRPGEPGRLVLHVQWDGDDDQKLFRSSPECAEFFRVLGSRVRELEEAEYRADETLLLASLGGAQVWDLATGNPLTPPLIHRESVNIQKIGVRLVRTTVAIWSVTVPKV